MLLVVSNGTFHMFLNFTLSFTSCLSSQIRSQSPCIICHCRVIVWLFATTFCSKTPALHGVIVLMAYPGPGVPPRRFAILGSHVGDEGHALRRRGDYAYQWPGVRPRSSIVKQLTRVAHWGGELTKLLYPCPHWGLQCGVCSWGCMTCCPSWRHAAEPGFEPPCLGHILYRLGDETHSTTHWSRHLSKPKIHN